MSKKTVDNDYMWHQNLSNANAKIPSIFFYFISRLEIVLLIVLWRHQLHQAAKIAAAFDW